MGITVKIAICKITVNGLLTCIRSDTKRNILLGGFGYRAFLFEKGIILN